MIFVTVKVKMKVKISKCLIINKFYDFASSFINGMDNQALWSTYVILTLRNLRKEDCYLFETSLGSNINLNPVVLNILILWSFNIIPYIVMTHSCKIILLTLHNCNFTLNQNVNIRNTRYLMWDPYEMVTARRVMNCMLRTTDIAYHEFQSVIVSKKIWPGGGVHVFNTSTWET